MWLSFWLTVNISIPMPWDNYSTSQNIIVGYLSPASFTWINKQTVAFWKKKQTLKAKEKTLVNTAKYFDLIITFCFSPYDSWMLSDKYTFKYVTLNLELKTFLQQNMTKFHACMKNFLSDCHLSGSFPRGINLVVVQFPFNCLSRIFFPITYWKEIFKTWLQTK